MNKNKTELHLIIDRSGSMNRIKDDIEGGIKTLLAEQRKLPGECLVSAYQFDDIYETLFEGKPISEVSDVTITPRGSTALHYAIGRTINIIGERLANTKEEDRPGRVSITIITDGLNNIAREFTAEQVSKMVELQTKTYSWDFSFLGCEQNALAAGQSVGVAQASSLSFGSSSKSIGATFSALSRKMSAYRSYNEADILRGFSADERVKAEGK